MILYVACGGLVINIGGLFIFGHGHSHGSSHGHSHEHSHGHSHEIKQLDEIDSHDEHTEFDALEIISTTIKNTNEDIESSKSLMNTRKQNNNLRPKEEKRSFCSCFSKFFLLFEPMATK